jgi:uridylate kinase
MVTVISLGGSIVAPGEADENFLRDFLALVREFLDLDRERRFIFVVGGGGPARSWQKVYRNIIPGGDDGEADWIGIMATRLNAQLVRALMREWCQEEVVTDPGRAEFSRGRILLAAGWKPGFSTDYDAVLLAEKFGAGVLINLSNVAQVYTDDPKKNPQATPIEAVSWKDFRAMVGDQWVPGKNVPFDPVASRRASEIGLKVICAAGRDLDNLRKILRGDEFIGTAIGP